MLTDAICYMAGVSASTWSLSLRFQIGALYAYRSDGPSPDLLLRSFLFRLLEGERIAGHRTFGGDSHHSQGNGRGAWRQEAR